jgi:hypothetical protein
VIYVQMYAGLVDGLHICCKMLVFVI